jgi:hypothetical protein
LFRRFSALLVCAVLALMAVSPALAKDRVVIKATSGKGSGTVSVATRMTPGHRFRIDVTSKKPVQVRGAGFENYTYILNKQLGTGTKNVTLSGSTPRSLVVDQPIKAKLDSWLLVVTVTDSNRQALTLRVVDLGKH